ncbi:MAG: phosphatase PAP2 family protein [Anaerolineae bacterium]|nr:phosphatase PAP2 family protein [Anaerolineae bacterium]
MPANQEATPRTLERMLQADAAISARLVPRWEPLRWLALAVAHSGDSPVWLLAGAMALFGGDGRWAYVGIRIVVATLAGGVAATLLKFVFRRRRPAGPNRGLYAKQDLHSFPSGHATRAGCVTAVLLPLLPGWGAVALIGWAIALCLARVALQVHYLLDMVGGLAIGGMVGLLLLAVLPYLPV